MLTISGGKCSGCCAIAVDSVAPPWTSVLTLATASLSLGLAVCSSRMASERSRVSPEEVIEANWRAKIGEVLQLGPAAEAGQLEFLVEPGAQSADLEGVSRWLASVRAAPSGESDSILPLTIVPVWSIAS